MNVAAYLSNCVLCCNSYYAADDTDDMVVT